MDYCEGGDLTARINEAKRDTSYLDQILITNFHVRKLSVDRFASALALQSRAIETTEALTKTQRQFLRQKEAVNLSRKSKSYDGAPKYSLGFVCADILSRNVSICFNDDVYRSLIGPALPGWLKLYWP